ncbi:hypothetical protein PGTUg99_016494 [Puccinia graminis f. sp. tritici]|uniref:Uncharacterized protein n=1 Tax=Puccinia graminis f. sp. tritici TaxID=56615 RepID=A0A5B0NAN7_PUCGR|nr:hypothetical protein PGTUg99_016494 [Puccinia graminis f. sp. tritici]
MILNDNSCILKAVESSPQQIKKSIRNSYRNGQSEITENPASSNLFKSLGTKESEEHAQDLKSASIFHQQAEGPRNISSDLFSILNLIHYIRSPAKEIEKRRAGFDKPLRLSQTCRSEWKPIRSFWISRKEAIEFLETCKFNHVGRSYSYRQEKRKIGKMLLHLSTQRLDIRENSIFTDQIMRSFEVKLEHWIKLKTSNKENGIGSKWFDMNCLRRKRNHILQYVTNVTKISSFLIITYLYLFKQHNGEILNGEDFNQVFAFLRDLWNQDKKDASLKGKEYLHIRRMENLTSPDEHTYRKYDNGASLWFFTSEDIFNYWINKNKRNYGRNDEIYIGAAKFKLIRMVELIIASSKDRSYTTLPHQMSTLHQILNP